MKNTIKLALVAAMAMGATSAFATNGDNLIGLGAKSRAMGGTGIAHFNGSENALSNVALITKVKGTEISFGGTYFAPDVEFEGSSSEADKNMIPEVSIAANIGDGVTVGVGMFGSAGMGVDYRNAADANAYGMATNLMLMKFAVPVAYETEGLSVGIAPVLQYGAMGIKFNYDSGQVVGDAPTGKSVAVGHGVSQDFGFGFELGAAYDLGKIGVDGVTLGAVYKSSIEMEYEHQIANAAGLFGLGSLITSDKLEQPAEIGVGVDYTAGDISVTLDYKLIKWESAEGYKQFGWKDQDVIALGLEYRMDDLSVRAGYNYATNPLENTANPALNTLNFLGFPATVESHYTAGLGYAFSKQVSADFAVTYAAEKKESALVVDNTFTPYTAETKHSQLGVSAAVNFNF